MTCRRIDLGLGHGMTGIVCTRGERAKGCKECGARATKQCDYPLKGSKTGKTCDAYLCARCAVNVGPERDYCGPHARIAEQLALSEVR